MIDQQFQAAIARLNRESTPKFGKLPILLVGAGFGSLLTGIALTAAAVIAQPSLDEDALGKLAAMAACSTGQSPAVEWEMAQENSSVAEDYLGWANIQIARKLLSIIDTDRCTGHQPLSSQHYEGI